MEKTMQPQEATKEPMVELDTGGNAVDVELKQEKEIQVEEQKDDKVESQETKKETKIPVIKSPIKILPWNTPLGL